MRKIDVTRQFFEASGLQGHFFEKQNKNSFLDMSWGVCAPNFRSVSFFVWPGGATHINTYTHILVKKGVSSTGWLLALRGF